MSEENFTFENWRKRILEIRDQKTERESIEFCDLVDKIDNAPKDLNIAVTLFQTFTKKPDHGVKECVVNELGIFDVETYYQAYFQDLPRLYKETQRTEWYSVMASYTGRELNKDEWDIIVKIARSMPEETQNIFKDIISDEDFMDDNDWAEYVLEKLKNSK